MSVLLLIMGQVLLGLVSLDVLVTTLTVRGGVFHLTYPVLHYFHTPLRSRCLPLSIAALDEAMSLMQYAVPLEIRPDPAVLFPARRSCAAFLSTLKSTTLNPVPKHRPQFL